MFIITGGAGFIGSHLVEELNKRGETDIIVVDDLTDARKVKNLSSLKIYDYVDFEELFNLLSRLNPGEVKTLFHMGAISSTQEENGKLIMKNNYDYSIQVLHFCLKLGIRLIYASSGSVYGLNEKTEEVPENEKPITAYGYSKLLFDQKIRQLLENQKNINAVGLRFFNVYGANEHHKDGQASPFYRGYANLKRGKPIELLVGPTDTALNAEYFMRDFVYVEDCADVCLWMAQHNSINGIFNVGTGEPKTFQSVARKILKTYSEYQNNAPFWDSMYHFPDLEVAKQHNLVKEKSFPYKMFGKSQPKTKADLIKLREAGYSSEFSSIDAGWEKMYEQLRSKDGGFRGNY